MQLIRKLRQRSLNQLLSREILLVGRSIGCYEMLNGYTKFRIGGRGDTYCTKRRRAIPDLGTTVLRARLQNLPFALSVLIWREWDQYAPIMSTKNDSLCTDFLCQASDVIRSPL